MQRVAELESRQVEPICYMPEDFMREVIELAKPYFPEVPLDRLRKLLTTFPPTHSPFKQITQVEDQPVLEVGYQSGRLLVDYTFKVPEETLSVLKATEVRGISLFITASSSKLTISAGEPNFFQYVASVESYRAELERYGERLRELMAG
jgi:hypothetical protein